MIPCEKDQSPRSRFRFQCLLDLTQARSQLFEPAKTPAWLGQLIQVAVYAFLVENSCSLSGNRSGARG